MALTNSEYEKIKRIYDERRLENDRLLSKRREEVYEKLPAYKALEDKIADISMECSRALIRMPDEAERKAYMDKLHSDILDKRMEKKKLLAANGYERDYLDPVYSCPKCRDTGFIDGEKCSCFKQLELEPLYDASRIRELLAQNNFSRLSYDYYKGEDLHRFTEAVKTCRQFISEFGTEYRNLLLYGTVGTGKTFLSCCVAKELLDSGRSIIYFNAQQLFQSISAHLYDKDKEELNSLYERIYGSELLLIDDLGTETVNEFTRAQLFTIINERTLRSNPVIISTNLELENIRQLYSDRVLSRLTANSFVCHLTGRDIRLQKNAERQYNNKVN